MARRSKFDDMAPEIVDEVNRLIRGGRTIAEIREHLSGLGVAVSNGAAGRYVQRAREHMRRFREAQEIAGQWVEQLGESPRGDVGTLLAELLKSVAFNTLDSLAGQADDPSGKPAKPMDIMLLAKAIRDLESTTKQSMDRRAAIEQAALKRQADKAEKFAKSRGMTADLWADIRAEFLGIEKASAA